MNILILINFSNVKKSKIKFNKKNYVFQKMKFYNIVGDPASKNIKKWFGTF